MTYSPVDRQGAAQRGTVALRLRGRTAPQAARVYWPQRASHTAALLLLFNGGGVPGLIHDDANARTLSSRAGVVVVTVPHIPGPDDFRDAVAAVEWVADHGAELGADPGRLLLAGDGGGGGAAAAVALHARDQGWPALVRQILIFPRIPLPGPGGAGGLPTGLLAGVSPAIVLTLDGPRQDDGAPYAALLRDAGVEVDLLRYDHRPGGERVVTDLAVSLRKALSARAPPHRPDPAARHTPEAAAVNVHQLNRSARTTTEVLQMRKVQAGLFSSVDGVIESPDQWQPGFDEEMGATLARMLDEQDTVLLGRVTYTEWAEYWPTSTDEPFASWINGTQKYVASETLDTVGWENSTLIKGPVNDFVARLREKPGGAIGIAGSPTLVRSLLQAGLLDELTLMISPVVAGGGLARLFPEDSPQTGLKLVEAKPTSSGAVIATYGPAR
ncbi:alpha/beta hydrolase fold domain-containing protein [Spirillospora sp. NPDC048819]|uniref:alpha/beta hydrolase fold domain-containing protein n=1 Tax=Spirillospora sp. NPDC048819 TaxID=3155268 RepID=UPI0033FE2382